MAIAVTAISLLVSPLWFNLMERVEDMASEGLGSYKQALSQAYEDELDGVENVVWATRARYRAVRFALYQRKARRSAGKTGPHTVAAAGPVDEGVIQAPESSPADVSEPEKPQTNEPPVTDRT